MEYCFAEINLSNYAQNLAQIKAYLPHSTKIMAVIKANAYGHGIVEIAKKAVECGIYALGVARIDEALIVREALPRARIVILGYTPEIALDSAIANDIEICVFHREIAESISQKARAQGKIAQIHIKLDTGMGRIGFLCYEQNSSLGMQFRTCEKFWESADFSPALSQNFSQIQKPHRKYFDFDSQSESATNQMQSAESTPDSAISEILAISKLENIAISGIFTHFSSADEENLGYTQMQMERYVRVIRGLKAHGISDFIRHSANSAGIFNHPQSVFDMVRVGIASFCGGEFAQLKLKPVMSFKARVVHIKTLPKDSAISYGRTFITQKESKIATLCVGYADGYSRALSNRAEVLICGKRAKVVGNVCMDQLCVDVSGIENVEIGAVATLFGVDEFGGEISANELAGKIGTISYEILCAVSARVERIYIG